MTSLENLKDLSQKFFDLIGFNGSDLRHRDNIYAILSFFDENSEQLNESLSSDKDRKQLNILFEQGNSIFNEAYSTSDLLNCMLFYDKFLAFDFEIADGTILREKLIELGEKTSELPDFLNTYFQSIDISEEKKAEIAVGWFVVIVEKAAREEDENILTELIDDFFTFIDIDKDVLWESISKYIDYRYGINIDESVEFRREDKGVLWRKLGIEIYSQEEERYLDG